MIKLYMILACLIATLSLSGCSLFRDTTIDNAIEGYIENERSIPIKTVAIPVIYLTECLNPSPPNTADMLAYEAALRDALVSFKECKYSKHELIKQVLNRQEVPE